MPRRLVHAELVRQFEAARRHGKTWVLEDSDHRVHMIDPAAVRYVRIEAAGGPQIRRLTGRTPRLIIQRRPSTAGRRDRTRQRRSRR